MAEGDTGLSGMGGLCLCVWVFGVESLCWVGASRVGLADMLGMAVPCLAWQHDGARVGRAGIKNAKHGAMLGEFWK